jgi:hypothetical protein
LAFALQIVLPGAGGQAVAQAGKAAYAAMAPLDQYLIFDEKSEIALARSAAPGSISDGAEVMVLGRDGKPALILHRQCAHQMLWPSLSPSLNR